MNSQILRGVIGVSVALLLILSLLAYGGVGVNLTFFSREIGVENDPVYGAVGVYGVSMAVLLLIVGALLVGFFSRHRFGVGARIRKAVLGVTLVLAILHLAAAVDLVPVANAEAKSLFIVPSAAYALATIGAVLLFTLLVWLGREKRSDGG